MGFVGYIQEKGVCSFAISMRFAMCCKAAKPMIDFMSISTLQSSTCCIQYRQAFMQHSLVDGELVHTTHEFVSTNGKIYEFFGISPPVCLYL